MQLKELSERTGVSPASIKFYLREGLLPAGRSIHATRAEYSEQHVSRLELIQALRNVVGLPIAKISSLVRMADDGVPRLELLAAVQHTVLGLDEVSTESDARNALNAQLVLMEDLGVPVTAELLDAYSEAVDAIAAVNISATTEPEDVNRLIMTAALGMHLHGQLVLKLLALAHASHAIRRYENEA